MLKHTINTLLLKSCLATLATCSAGGYQRIEEKSPPRYQAGKPVMSDLKVVCRTQVFIRPAKWPRYHPELPQLTNKFLCDGYWDFLLIRVFQE